jgi:sterol desaturase/sphingolipid hydroxylase (fatty acid hydroxylase superfamily)
MPADLEVLTPLTAAIALGLLWIAEAILPSIWPHGTQRVAWTTRFRNLVIATPNALIAAAFAGLTLLVTQWSMREGFGVLNWLRPVAPEGVWGSLSLALAAFVLLDLWHYAFHVMAHKLPLLWRFHVLHHNADTFEATVAMRFHFCEVAVQCALSLPVYAMLGVSIEHILLYNLILLPVAMFHHADMGLPVWLDRVMRVVIVTPHMHVIHHSQWEPETDSNFSAVLSVWDRLFGSYRWRDDPGTVEIGIDGYSSEQVHSVKEMLQTGLLPAHSTPGNFPEPQTLPRSLRIRDERWWRRRKQAAKESSVVGKAVSD